MKAKVVAFGVLVVTAGCGTFVRGVTFTGTRHPPLVGHGQVTERSPLPDDHEVIGEVVGRCIVYSGDPPAGLGLLSDLACSEMHLRANMRRTVAESGGDLLVSPTCTTKREDNTRWVDDKLGGEKRVYYASEEVDCQGYVARPKLGIVGGSR